MVAKSYRSSIDPRSQTHLICVRFTDVIVASYMCSIYEQIICIALEQTRLPRGLGPVMCSGPQDWPPAAAPALRSRGSVALTLCPPLFPSGKGPGNCKVCGVTPGLSKLNWKVGQTSIKERARKWSFDFECYQRWFWGEAWARAVKAVWCGKQINLGKSHVYEVYSPGFAEDFSAVLHTCLDLVIGWYTEIRQVYSIYF